MSVRSTALRQNSIDNTVLINNTYSKTLWSRNRHWPALSITENDNKMVGLYAVFPGTANWFAFNISGNYTIDHGDGNVVNNNAGTYYYNYDYTSSNLDGTDIPVTFTASTDTVNRTAHGYSLGEEIIFYNIQTTTGIESNKTYYVIDSSADSFKVSATKGGSAITLTNDGSATLLPYKIAQITLTPQAGQNLTAINLQVKHNQTSLVNGYSSGWLDIGIASANLTSLTISGTSANLRHLYLENVDILKMGNITSLNNCFQNCLNLRRVNISADTSTLTNLSSVFSNCVDLVEVYIKNTSAVTNMSNLLLSCRSLKNAPVLDTSNVTNMTLMFGNCNSLEYVPYYDTSNVTNMNSMFAVCQSLKRIPTFDTSSVTILNAMFNGCYALEEVPAFNTNNVTLTSLMFQDCRSLITVPLFNTSSVTDMASMFNNCYSLIECPAYDTSNVTRMPNMFSNCYNLTKIPTFNTSKVTTMSDMFTNCYSLIECPAFDTSNVTTMSSMFSGCQNLKRISAFNTSKVNTMTSMFSGCLALEEVPALDMSVATSSSSYSSMFSTAASIKRIQGTGIKFTINMSSLNLSSAALNEIYTNLATVTGQTITVSTNWGVTGDDPTIATAKGWTVTG